MLRRNFIRETGIGLASTIILPNRFSNQDNTVLTFGLVADVHKDLMPDADQRLEAFISEAMNRKIDIIIQLGDFCMGVPDNDHFMKIWHSFPGPRYHVLGNHDMDKNSKGEMLDYWNMPATYYSFVENGIRFIILDANFLYQDGEFIDYSYANFYVDNSLRTYINTEQIEWLEGTLKVSQEPVIVLSHQSLWHYQWGVKNRLEIQHILEQYAHQIICCMNGHNHIDYHHVQNGINYLEINSMSYYWLGEKYKNFERYPAAMYKKYQWLSSLGTYQDPLFAFVTIKDGMLILEGKASDWVSPSPYESGMPWGVVGNRATAEISDYRIGFIK